jgi:hypothetical protein
VTANGSDPAVNATGIHAKEVGNLLSAVSLTDTLHREKSSMFQFRG